MSSVYFSFFLSMIQSRYPCRCLVLTPCFCLIRFFASACSSLTDDTVFPFGDTYAPDGMTSLSNPFSDTNVWILWLSSLIIFVLSEKCFLCKRSVSVRLVWYFWKCHNHGKREYFSLSLPTGIHSGGSFHYTAASTMGLFYLCLKVCPIKEAKKQWKQHY